MFIHDLWKHIIASWNSFRLTISKQINSCITWWQNVHLVLHTYKRQACMLEARTRQCFTFKIDFWFNSWHLPANCSVTVYHKKYAHGFVVLCFVVVMQSFIMNSHEVFIHIHQGCFAGTGAIVRLPQCQWSKPDGYGKISQCLTTTKHSKAKTVCIFLGIYCSCQVPGLILEPNRIFGHWPPQNSYCLSAWYSNALPLVSHLHVPVPKIYGTRIRWSLCLQIIRHLAVLNHQQE